MFNFFFNFLSLSLSLSLSSLLFHTHMAHSHTLSFSLGHLTQSESIFYYHNSNYNIFNTDTPSFYPLYGLRPLIENSVLNATANKICDDDYSCRYDIAVTGNGDFGRSTNEINQMNKKLKDSLGLFRGVCSCASFLLCA